MTKGDEKWPFREPGARVPRGFVTHFSPSPSGPPPSTWWVFLFAGRH